MQFKFKCNLKLSELPTGQSKLRTEVLFFTYLGTKDLLSRTSEVIELAKDSVTEVEKCRHQVCTVSGTFAIWQNLLYWSVLLGARCLPAVSFF
jgi:hypothetical protein